MNHTKIKRIYLNLSFNFDIFNFDANLDLASSSWNVGKDRFIKVSNRDNHGEFIVPNFRNGRTSCAVESHLTREIWFSQFRSVVVARRKIPRHGRTHEIRFSRFVYRSSALKAWAAELANKRSKGKEIEEDISPDV